MRREAPTRSPEPSKQRESGETTQAVAPLVYLVQHVLAELKTLALAETTEVAMEHPDGDKTSDEGKARPFASDDP